MYACSELQEKYYVHRDVEVQDINVRRIEATCNLNRVKIKAHVLVPVLRKTHQFHHINHGATMPCRIVMPLWLGSLEP